MNATFLAHRLCPGGVDGFLNCHLSYQAIIISVGFWAFSYRFRCSGLHDHIVSMLCYVTDSAGEFYYSMLGRVGSLCCEAL